MRLAQIMAEKITQSTDPVSVLLPLRGLSEINIKGKAFYSPEADQALLSALKKHLKSSIPLIEMDEEVNSPDCVKHCVKTLLALMKEH